MRVIVKHVGWGTWRWKVTDWHGTVASGCASTRWGALHEARRAAKYAKEAIIEEQS